MAGLHGSTPKPSKPACPAAVGAAPCALCTRHAPFAALVHCGACKAVVCCACCAAPGASGPCTQKDEPLCLECACAASQRREGSLYSGLCCSDSGGDDSGSDLGTPECARGWGSIERACREAALRPARGRSGGAGAHPKRGGGGHGAAVADADCDAGLPFAWCSF
ncbi:hypothetical protein Rsub_06309 [Raphidocelis subcapitata]|uniref:Uncharacterized protein n=1 Tax=Raphidocelis subcapitata TaxID=307507 RepID=A0A2V0P1Y7_9CHLO|nr:hypothetical protein Rsub_06309 [Raphidocelis subcapitata]|eukprot:GBF93589.1 hypothetical protein Rsub_06309 [Raphidocelis subcapitata]